MKRNVKNGSVCRPLAEIMAERRKRDARIIERHLAGLTQTEIARAVGCTQGTVNRVLAAKGLRPRERAGRVTRGRQG